MKEKFITLNMFDLYTRAQIVKDGPKTWPLHKYLPTKIKSRQLGHRVFEIDRQLWHLGEVWNKNFVEKIACYISVTTLVWLLGMTD